MLLDAAGPESGFFLPRTLTVPLRVAVVGWGWVIANSVPTLQREGGHMIVFPVRRFR